MADASGNPEGGAAFFSAPAVNIRNSHSIEMQAVLSPQEVVGAGGEGVLVFCLPLSFAH